MTHNSDRYNSNYFSRQRSLLQMEYECDKNQYRKINETRGIEQNVRRGLCRYPVSIGRCYYNSLNQFAVEIHFASVSDEDSAFEYGRQVNFFYEELGGGIQYIGGGTATVSFVEEERLVVILQNPAMLQALKSRSNLGVQVAFDETSYVAMFEALDSVEKARDGRLAELRDILLSKSKARFREIYPVRLPWLNRSQETAVNRILCSKDVMVVHGPPGTGKTTTLVEAIYETLHRETQVLVCAQSNTAVDCICDKLVDRGIPVLRIGNPSRVDDKMLSHTYERQYESHPLYPELWGIRNMIRRIQSTRGDKTRGERDKLANRLHNLKKRGEELEIAIDADLFNNARVVASTLVSSNHRLLNGHHFSSLFIDEAGQALEAATWIPIRKSDRVIFAGDHHQLPPTVKSVEAERGGLGYTLMEREVNQDPSISTLLTVQYRMHERIMQFSSNQFYGGALMAAPDVRYRGILDFDTPMEWVDTADLDTEEQFVASTNSRINKAEAEILVERLERYIQSIGSERIENERIDVGVISPYKAQVNLLKKLVKRSTALRPYRKVLTVNTIDGFQGQERDVIFISMVRSNDSGDIGFLRELRRMNVAITRAKMKLVIVGNSRTLSKSKFYSQLHRYITEEE